MSDRQADSMPDAAQSREVSIEVAFDLETQKSVAKMGPENEISEVGRGIANSIESALRGMTRSWFPTFIEKLDAGDDVAAYHVFEANRGSMLIARDKSQLDTLLRLNVQALVPEQRQLFELFVIGFGSMVGAFLRIEPLVDSLLAEFGEALDQDAYWNLFLTKANCAAISGKNLLATSWYERVISSKASSAIRAWAHRGLSSCVVDPTEKAEHLEGARDLFLESGHRRDAIAAMVSVSDIYSNSDPAKALTLLSEAAELDSTGQAIGP